MKEEDGQSLFDADISISIGEIIKATDALIESLGGLQVPDADLATQEQS